MNKHFFVTVDAETSVIAEGIETLSAIRDQTEKATGIRIPMVWFVRFQRSWTDSVHNESPKFFNGPLEGEFDGFALARKQLLRMQQRGDEIAWHYHAYNYVERNDLSHELKIEILKADMLSCATELRRRYPGFATRSLRFGWWFIPDYSIFVPLATLGFDIDASMNPNRGGNVNAFSAQFLPPLSHDIGKIDQTWFFPFNKTICLHDWNVVQHQFNWSEMNKTEVQQKHHEVASELNQIAVKIKEMGGQFLTYKTYLKSRDTSALLSSSSIETESESVSK